MVVKVYFVNVCVAYIIIHLGADCVLSGAVLSSLWCFV